MSCVMHDKYQYCVTTSKTKYLWYYKTETPSHDKKKSEHFICTLLHWIMEHTSRNAFTRTCLASLGGRWSCYIRMNYTEHMQWHSAVATKYKISTHTLPCHVNISCHIPGVVPSIGLHSLPGTQFAHFRLVKKITRTKYQLGPNHLNEFFAIICSCN